jgi:hypothetical protein
MQLIKNLLCAFVVLIIVVLMHTCGKPMEYRPRRRWLRFRRYRH